MIQLKSRGEKEASPWKTTMVKRGLGLVLNPARIMQPSNKNAGSHEWGPAFFFGVGAVADCIGGLFTRGQDAIE